MKIIKYPTLITLALSLTACGTINRYEEMNKNYYPRHNTTFFYQSVRHDFSELQNPFKREPFFGGESLPIFLTAPIIAVADLGFIIDTPISLVVDTLYLPIDYSHSKVRASVVKKYEKSQQLKDKPITLRWELKKNAPFREAHINTYAHDSEEMWKLLKICDKTLFTPENIKTIWKFHKTKPYGLSWEIIQWPHTPKEIIKEYYELLIHKLYKREGKNYVYTKINSKSFRQRCRLTHEEINDIFSKIQKKTYK